MKRQLMPTIPAQRMNRMIIVMLLVLGFFAFDKILLAPALVAEPVAAAAKAITPSVVPPPARDQQADQVDKTTCPKSVRQVLEVSNAKKMRWADMRAPDFDKHFGASAQKVLPTRALIDRFFQLAK